MAIGQSDLNLKQLRERLRCMNNDEFRRSVTLMCNPKEKVFGTHLQAHFPAHFRFVDLPPVLSGSNVFKGRDGTRYEILTANARRGGAGRAWKGLCPA